MTAWERLLVALVVLAGVCLAVAAVNAASTPGPCSYPPDTPVFRAGCNRP